MLLLRHTTPYRYSTYSSIWGVLLDREAQPTAARGRICDGRDRLHDPVPGGNRRALHRSRGKRREARPARRRAHHVLHREPQAVAFGHGAHIAHARGTGLFGERACPAERRTAVWGVLAGERDATCRDPTRSAPGERELVALTLVHFFGVFFDRLFLFGFFFDGLFFGVFIRLGCFFLGRVAFIGAAALGREGPFAFGVGPATSGEIALGEAVRVGTAAAAHAHHALELAALHFEHRTVPQAGEQERTPRFDRHRNAVAHEVHVARVGRRHERAVAVDRVRACARGVARQHVVQVRVLGEIVVRGGVDPPRLEHPLPPECAHLLPEPIACALASLQEPHPAVAVIVVHGGHVGIGADAGAFAHACKLGVGDEHHVREVVVAGEEACLGDERLRHSCFHEVHRAFARRLHERAVRVPERHREHRGVEVTRGEATGEVGYRDARHARSERGIARRDLEPFDGGAVDPVFRGVAVVATDVEVIARRRTGGSLEPDDLPCGHLAPVLHEDGGQVRHDDVGAITHVDVHVVAEVGVGVAVVHVGDAAHGRVDDLVLVVRGVEVDVVAGRRSRVGVGSVRALATAIAVALGKRHVDGDGIVAPTVLADHAIGHAPLVAAPGHEEQEQHTEDVDHGFSASGDRVRIHSYSPCRGSPEGSCKGNMSPGCEVMK